MCPPAGFAVTAMRKRKEEAPLRPTPTFDAQLSQEVGAALGRGRLGGGSCNVWPCLAHGPRVPALLPCHVCAPRPPPTPKQPTHTCLPPPPPSPTHLHNRSSISSPPAASAPKRWRVTGWRRRRWATGQKPSRFPTTGATAGLHTERPGRHARKAVRAACGLGPCACVACAVGPTGRGPTGVLRCSSHAALQGRPAGQHQVPVCCGEEVLAGGRVCTCMHARLQAGKSWLAGWLRARLGAREAAPACPAPQTLPHTCRCKHAGQGS